MNGVAGTGKTLVARALAATASKAGTKVSFFMRKGADVLSKWVGEAERQLRLLFEEAQKAQPAIIFFDEIDGLAPVRHHCGLSLPQLHCMRSTSNSTTLLASTFGVRCTECIQPWSAVHGMQSTSVYIAYNQPWYAEAAACDCT